MTPEEILKENTDWAKTPEGKEAFRRLTHGVPRDELAEVHLITAIREARRELTLQDFSRILRETLPAEELEIILKK